jgi:hypothetical protein
MDRVKLVVACALVAACGDNRKLPADAVGADASTDPPALDAPSDGNQLEPATLAGTGLCIDAACTQISPDVHAYTPRWPLWADAASKRRWVYLPPGTQIDSSDMDHWKFPVGTKFWKEFTSGATRVETRYIVKVGPGDLPADWFYVAYAWNATQDATMAVPLGVADANGTTHDIPSRSNCKRCHENLKPTRILGFGALQLDYTNPTAGELDLDAVVAGNLLTVSPVGAASPHYPLPTDGTAGSVEALGYLHANCGHCHNPTSDVYVSNGITMFLRENVGTLGSVAQTPPYLTAVDKDAQQLQPGLTKIIASGAPGQSIMILRFEAANDSPLHMPPVAVETTDPTGDTTLRTWISNL